MSWPGYEKAGCLPPLTANSSGEAIGYINGEGTMGLTLYGQNGSIIGKRLVISDILTPYEISLRYSGANPIACCEIKELNFLQ